MADSPKQQQKRNRTRRLSASLRDNLKRRKTQARGRREQGAATAGGSAQPQGYAGTHDSAGIVEDKHSPGSR